MIFTLRLAKHHGEVADVLKTVMADSVSLAKQPLQKTEQDAPGSREHRWTGNDVEMTQFKQMGRCEIGHPVWAYTIPMAWWQTAVIFTLRLAKHHGEVADVLKTVMADSVSLAKQPLQKILRIIN